MIIIKCLITLVSTYYKYLLCESVNWSSPCRDICVCSFRYCYRYVYDEGKHDRTYHIRCRCILSTVEYSFLIWYLLHFLTLRQYYFKWNYFLLNICHSSIVNKVLLYITISDVILKNHIKYRCILRIIQNSKFYSFFSNPFRTFF